MSAIPIDYMPSLSPSSCSDATLIGTPESPSKSFLAKDMSGLVIKPAQMINPFDRVALRNVTLNEVEQADKENYMPEQLTKRISLPLRARRNAISDQASTNDTIVCHGPQFGAVFGDVSGSSGNITYDHGYFSDRHRVKARTSFVRSHRMIKKHGEAASSVPLASPSIAYYLSPTYGLPDSPQLPSPSTFSAPLLNPSEVPVDEDSDDEVRSAFSSSSEEEIEEVVVPRRPLRPRLQRASHSRTLCRSPASHTLSRFLAMAPTPPPRLDERALLSAPCGGSLMQSNRPFLEAIGAHTNARQASFTLTIPVTTQNAQNAEVEQGRMAWECATNAASMAFTRRRQASQRITLQEVALQAGQIAHQRRTGLAAADGLTVPSANTTI